MIAIVATMALLPGLYFAVLLFLAGLRRLFEWMDDRGWITYTGGGPTYGTIGNAALELQKIFEPGKQHVLEQKKTRRKKQAKPTST